MRFGSTGGGKMWRNGCGIYVLRAGAAETREAGEKGISQGILFMSLLVRCADEPGAKSGSR